MLKSIVLLFLFIFYVAKESSLFAQQHADLILVYDFKYQDQFPKELGVNCTQNEYKDNISVPLTIVDSKVTGFFTTSHSNYCNLMKGVPSNITITQTTQNNISGTLHNGVLNLLLKVDQAETFVINMPRMKPVTQTKNSKNEKAVEIPFTDGATLSQSFSMDKVSAKLTMTLKLCKPKSNKIEFVLRPSREEIMNMTYTSDHTKNDQQITALKGEFSEGLPVGLTIMSVQPRVFPERVLGPGAKSIYLTGLEFIFQVPKIYISNKYPVASCAYNAIYAHELDHAESYKKALLIYYDKIICDLNSFPFPSKENPLPVKNEAEGEAQLKRYIEAAYSDVKDQLRKEIQRVTRELDSQENYIKVNAHCPKAEW